MSDDTFSRYAKSAGVVTPEQGQREHRYDREDVLKICRTIINSTATKRFKEAAARLLTELGGDVAV